MPSAGTSAAKFHLEDLPESVRERRVAEVERIREGQRTEVPAAARRVQEAMRARRATQRRPEPREP